MISHAPSSVKVPRTKPTLLERSGHHDIEDEIQSLRPRLRVTLGKQVEKQSQKLVDFPMVGLAQSHFLRAAGCWHSVIDTGQSADLLHHGRSELLSSIMANDQGDRQSPQHGRTNGVHGVLLLQGRAGHQHRHPQEPAGVGAEVSKAFHALRKRSLEVDVDIQPGALVGLLVGNAH